MKTNFQSIIHKSKYARYLPELKRRETWEETVDRLMSFICKHLYTNYFDAEMGKGTMSGLHRAILNLEIMPSMRLLMTAGAAVERDNIAAYNCSYLAVNSKRAFSEALYILMNGTGVGFSCERQEIAHLPVLPDVFKEVDDTIVIGDSKLGWAKAYRKLLSSLWEGDIPKTDYSRIRTAGARLKTFGGRASGPEPMRTWFYFTTNTLL